MMIKTIINVDSRLRGNDSSRRGGSALLVVLGIVMAITIISLAFLSRSDVELACGDNMAMRTKCDYLAESGLEHARGLVLNPQEVSDVCEYWTGTTSQYIEEGDYYYDVTVEPNEYLSDGTQWCNYDISCEAYRLTQGEKTARSSLKAVLRLDPAIAYWSDSPYDRQLSSAVTINGDVYCADDLRCFGAIEGDVFCDTLILGDDGTKTGHKKLCDDLSLQWPDVNIAGFEDKYTFQSVTTSTLSGPVSGEYLKRSGDLEMTGNVQINGMLIVEGDLTVEGMNNSIVAQKNLPALLVTGDVRIAENGDLDIEGLAVVEGEIQTNIGCEDVNVVGGLFVKDGLFETVKDSSTGGSDAIIHGGPVCLPEGGHTAISFDGSDDYLQTKGSSTELQLINNYTFCVWVRANSSQKTWAGVFSKTNSEGLINHWTLQFDSSSPRDLIVHHKWGSWETGIEIDDIAGQWHHIAVVRSGNTMTSYLDGEPRDYGTFSESPESGYGHLNIGVDRTASSSYVYDGLIDDLRIYGQALDANDIALIKNGSEITSNPIAHWKFDEDGQRDIRITAAPAKTAVYLWSQTGEKKKWSQAGGVFYKDIRRN